MTAKELQEKCMALQRECNDKQFELRKQYVELRKQYVELRKQYAIEHNPVKVGDIVTDHYHTIRVERMSVYCSTIPCMQYRGTELTKQGVPKKRQPVPNNPAIQTNVKSINGEPYKYEKEKL